MRQVGNISLRATSLMLGTLAGAATAGAQNVVDKAIATVELAKGPTDKWYGLTTGTAPIADQSIVCIEYVAQDITAAKWCKGAVDFDAKLDWKSTTIDGQGNADGQRRALQQAIALKPNGIVLASVDARSKIGLLKEATTAGIKIVGIRSVAGPGSAPDFDLFTNITYDPVCQATLAVDFAIADAKGGAQFIVVTDVTYAIARAKADASKATIVACPTCQMLDYVSTPVGSANQNMPGLFTSWIQKNPDPFYVFSVTDADLFDPGLPALRTGGVPPAGRIASIGSDGSPAADQRIRTGAYESGTIPEPAEPQGWQSIDELNRAPQGAPASGFVQPPHIITTENVGTDINADGIYDPKVDYRSGHAKIWGRE